MKNFQLINQSILFLEALKQVPIYMSKNLEKILILILEYLDVAVLPERTMQELKRMVF